jgi:hypothetical protein
MAAIITWHGGRNQFLGSKDVVTKPHYFYSMGSVFRNRRTIQASLIGEKTDWLINWGYSLIERSFVRYLSGFVRIPLVLCHFQGVLCN